ncbi:MAG: hypothetical protein ACM31L_17255, partial [Actinomycetota bacterium]
YMGEIAGQYLIFNSNVDVYQLAGSVQPVDGLKLSAIYYRFQWDQPRQFAGVTSDHALDELDLIAEYKVDDHLSLAGAVAAAMPGDGGKQFMRSQQGTSDRVDATWLVAEVSAIYKF